MNRCFFIFQDVSNALLSYHVCVCLFLLWVAVYHLDKTNVVGALFEEKAEDTCLDKEGEGLPFLLFSFSAQFFFLSFFF